MKTWITYITAMLMGFATALLIADSTAISSMLSLLNMISIDIGILICVPIMFVTFASGIASLGRDRFTGKVFSTTVLWSIATAVALPLVTALMTWLFPVAFPSTSTSSLAPFSSTFPLDVITGIASTSISGNTFYVLASSSTYLIPLIVLAWIFGLSLKPSADVIKPAYVTMNSFSEVCYRISKTYTAFGQVLVYFTSTNCFSKLYQDKSIFISAHFAASLVVMAFLLAMVVLPLLYLAFTKMGRNPYRDIFFSFAPLMASFTSGCEVAAAPLVESCARTNMGMQKRAVSTSVPLLLLLGKAGSASIATFCVITMITAANGTVCSLPACLIIALAAAAASFVSSTAPGFEAAFITILALRMTGIDLYGGEMTMFAILPFISGIGCVLDTEIALLGAGTAGVSIRTDVKPAYKDLV